MFDALFDSLETSQAPGSVSVVSFIKSFLPWTPFRAVTGSRRFAPIAVPEQEQWERSYHWPSHPRCSLKLPGCFSCRSASTAELRHFGKTCELWMLGRINRTCTAGLRHSVRPANCKCSPPTEFEVPNVGHPFLFLLPHVSFHSHSFSFSMLAAREAFSSPKGGLQLQLLYFLFTVLNFYVLRLRSQPPALLQSLCLFLFFFFRFPNAKQGPSKKACWLPAKRGVCVEHLFAKVSMIHSYTYMQGARCPLTQLAPTKLCVRWTGKRTCRSVPGC